MSQTSILIQSNRTASPKKLEKRPYVGNINNDTELDFMLFCLVGSFVIVFDCLYFELKELKKAALLGSVQFTIPVTRTLIVKN